MKENIYLIIDFDSTLVKIECLDELFALALRDNIDKGRIMEEFSAITRLGMDGKINFSESLERRMNLITAGKDDIEEFVGMLQGQITESFLRNREYLKKNSKNIYIFSGGFNNYVIPIITELGLLARNAFANNYIFDQSGKIIGFDKKHYLSQTGGKIKQLEALQLPGKKIVIGDGWTDYETKEAGAADLFIAFTENAARKSVMERADFIADSFDKVIEIVENKC